MSAGPHSYIYRGQALVTLWGKEEVSVARTLQGRFDPGNSGFTTPECKHPDHLIRQSHGAKVSGNAMQFV